MNHLANTVASFISIILVSPILSLLNSGDNIPLSVFKGIFYVANGGTLAYNLAHLLLLDLNPQTPAEVVKAETVEAVTASETEAVDSTFESFVRDWSN